MEKFKYEAVTIDEEGVHPVDLESIRDYYCKGLVRINRDANKLRRKLEKIESEKEALNDAIGTITKAMEKAKELQKRAKATNG